MTRTKDSLTLAWERNEPAVRLRYPHLTDADLRTLERLKVVPLATGELVPGPETVLEMYRASFRGRRKKLDDEETGDVPGV